MEVQLIMSSFQKALDCTDFCLTIDGDLQIKFFKVNFGVFGFDDLPVQIIFGKDSEQDDNTVVRELSCKLDLIVSITALFALKGGNDDFPEEG